MGANIITVCCSLSYMLICSMCYVSMVRLCYVSIFSLCSVSIFSMCYVFMHASLASLGGSSLRSLRPLRGRCGRFAAAGDHCVPGCLVESEGQREAAEPPTGQPGMPGCLVA